MAKLAWDQTGERTYETGVDHGVLYIPNVTGVYDSGVAWNGLVSVSESPSGAEASAQYADNIKYLNLISAEEFGATIEAFTYPTEFSLFDGVLSPTTGLNVGQQTRRPFGLSYRTKIGDDLVGTDRGYKIHLIYNALAAPTEKAYTTVNDSPEAITFSWELSTTPVEVPGYKPSATITIDSTKVAAAGLSALENALYGTVGTNPRLPTPAEVIAFFSGTVQVTAQPAAPAYNSTTKVITVPSTPNVVYSIDGVTRAPAAAVTITKDTVVTARPAAGYQFPVPSVDRWFVAFA